MSCSVFSMMQEFESNQAAIDTAEAVLIEIMNKENLVENEFSQRKIEDIWEKQDALKEKKHEVNQSQQESINSLANEDKEIHPNSYTRRQLLGGKFTKEVS